MGIGKGGYSTVYHSKQWNIKIKLFSITFKQGLYFTVEEVPVKWMDRPSATEMERGRASEMEIEISSIHFCDTWSCYPFHIDETFQKKF